MTLLPPLRVRVDRALTLLLDTELRPEGPLFVASVAEHPRVRVRASTLELALLGAREGVRRLQDSA